MPPNLLWIEMTESMMLEEPELAQRTLREIREMGVRLALDDFGTGYSSLSLLQQFPIQRIKIDRAFVSGIAEPGNDRSLVRTVIAMAQSMGLDLVAEGVETVQQLQVLSELNCDKAQGYLISRPVPADAMRSTMVALDELASLSMFGWSDATPDRHANAGTRANRRHHRQPRWKRLATPTRSPSAACRAGRSANRSSDAGRDKGPRQGALAHRRRRRESNPRGRLCRPLPQPLGHVASGSKDSGVAATLPVSPSATAPWRRRGYWHRRSECVNMTACDAAPPS